RRARKELRRAIEQRRKPTEHEGQHTERNVGPLPAAPIDYQVVGGDHFQQTLSSLPSGGHHRHSSTRLLQFPEPSPQRRCCRLPRRTTRRSPLEAERHAVERRSEEHTSELQSRENLVCR